MGSHLPYRSASDRLLRRAGRSSFWTLRAFLLTVLAGLSVLVAVTAGWWWTAPAAIEGLASGPPPEGWATWARQKERWDRDGVRRNLSHHYIPLEEIGPVLPHAVLVAEDVNFFGHRGVDPTAVREALREWRQGRRLRGASTITQQLAKSMFLTPERSYWRKVKEARFAWWLERRLGKRRILELYLNVVEFGVGIYGAEAGARHFYSVSARDLDEAQAAGLTAGIPSPGRDNPATRTARWERRRDVILKRMSGSKWLAEILTRLSDSGEGRGAGPDDARRNDLVNPEGSL